MVFAKRTFKLLLSLFPSLLPTTVDGLAAFISDVVSLGSWPETEGAKHAVSVMILHLGPNTIMKPKFFFYLALRKSVSNEIAYACMEDIKRKQAKLEEAKREQAEKATEAVVQEVKS